MPPTGNVGHALEALMRVAEGRLCLNRRRHRCAFCRWLERPRAGSRTSHRPACQSRGPGAPFSIRLRGRSERRDHFAGSTASAILDACIEKGWLKQHAGSRALIATPTGQNDLIDGLLAAP